MHKLDLRKPLQILLVLFLVFAGLYYAKPFLVPLCLAGMFAMLFVPLSNKFEKMGFNRGFAILSCILLLLFFLAGVIALISWQITNLTEDLGNIDAKIQSLVNEISDYISQALGISREKQEQVIEKQSENTSGVIGSLSGSIMSILVNFVLMLVYIFLLMYYRPRIKKFILQLVPKKEGDNTEDALDRIEKVSQQYLTGMGLMIICLWILYSIAFSIIGLKNSIFFAILCGLFEIVPFIGNLAGNILAMLMAFTQGGGIGMVLAIIATYAVIQFVQTYLLEPLVVGAEVNINPLFTIVGLVIAELVWGIPGLVLAIPLMGIIKIICDHIDALKPLGQLMGRDAKKSTLMEKLKLRFK